MLPKAGDADFVCAMEDVLEVYTRPYNPEEPLVCVDETTKQLVADVTPPLPMQPGQPVREDYEYERCGTANLFMVCEPLAGRRHVKVTERRTSADFAELLRELSDVHYPQAKKIVLVMDNLNTHKLSVLYQVFPPEEARRIGQRFEVHYTPKHASWLNMAEIEIGIMDRQCTGCRLPSEETLRSEVDAWQNRRNQARATIDWKFTRQDADRKLSKYYVT